MKESLLLEEKILNEKLNFDFRDSLPLNYMTTFLMNKVYMFPMVNKDNLISNIHSKELRLEIAKGLYGERLRYDNEFINDIIKTAYEHLRRQLQSLINNTLSFITHELQEYENQYIILDMKKREKMVLVDPSNHPDIQELGYYLNVSDETIFQIVVTYYLELKSRAEMGESLSIDDLHQMIVHCFDDSRLATDERKYIDLDEVSIVSYMLERIIYNQDNHSLFSTFPDSDMIHTTYDTKKGELIIHVR